MTEKSSNKPKSASYSSQTILLMYVTGAAIRYWLIFSKYHEIIANHIEVSTPLNSWKRVLEGLHLHSKGINPYEGDLLHEAPITMWLYKNLTSQKWISMEWVFILIDLATAVLLYRVAKRYTFQLFVTQEERKGGYAPDSADFFLSGSDFVNAPVFVGAAFLFNPYIIFNCAGLSTMVFHNFFLALFLFGLVQGWVFLSALNLVFCSVISFYPCVLIVPLFLNFWNIFKDKCRATISLVLFTTFLIIASCINSELSSGKYVQNVYGFILTVPDLKPNIGLFWYFFTEMFDHFRDLFIWSFQINATILYLVPLSIKFRKDPFLLSAALLFLISVFKSYPCLGDVGFILSLLPCFIHLFNYSQQGFLVGVIFLITSALGPILWHLWIYSNSANANFYFGVTLAFAIGQIFLVTDILFAYLKREFCLEHGKERKIDGKEALLILE